MAFVEKPIISKANGYKALFVILIIASAITIFRFGHDFGQWLYEQLHGK